MVARDNVQHGVCRRCIGSDMHLHPTRIHGVVMNAEDLFVDAAKGRDATVIMVQTEDGRWFWGIRKIDNEGRRYIELTTDLTKGGLMGLEKRSICCDANVIEQPKARTGIVTRWYECEACGEPCDIQVEGQENSAEFLAKADPVLISCCCKSKVILQSDNSWKCFFCDSVCNVRLPFGEDEIKHYLNRCIRLWRDKRQTALINGDKEAVTQAVHYVDAFQSVRTSIFGETLPE